MSDVVLPKKAVHRHKDFTEVYDILRRTKKRSKDKDVDIMIQAAINELKALEKGSK